MLSDNTVSPFVTICLPCYNSEKTILKTLNSIINQTYQNLEILIVDNHSSDNTLSICESVKDSRIKILRNDINIGGEQNWNRSIAFAAGEYIAIFHADDLYDPTIIERQIESFRKNPDINAVFTMAYYIDENDRIIGERNLPPQLKNKRKYTFIEIFVAILENHNSFLTTPSVMVRGNIYKKLSPFRVNIYNTSADLDMWFRILWDSPICILQEKLMKYRHSESQIGNRIKFSRTTKADFFLVMDDYLAIVKKQYSISDKSIKRYELLQNNDRIKCSLNFILNGDPRSAKKLLNQSISLDIFYTVLKNPHNPSTLVHFTMGIILFIALKISDGLMVAKFFKFVYGHLG